jgi:hypothetical protein
MCKLRYIKKDELGNEIGVYHGVCENPRCIFCGKGNIDREYKNYCCHERCEEKYTNSLWMSIKCNIFCHIPFLKKIKLYPTKCRFEKK